MTAEARTTRERTVYTAEVLTPAGLMYSCSIVVPEDAEYDDQHELIETVQAGVARMIGMDARRREPLSNVWCQSFYASIGELPAVPCVLPAGHYPDRPHEAPQPGPPGRPSAPMRWTEHGGVFETSC